MRTESGFTLIELMIVVAIIGILASIAIPAYQDFIIRSKVSETLAQMSQCKTTASEFYQSHNGWNTLGTGSNISTLGLCNTIATAHTLSMVINNVGMVTASIQFLGGATVLGDRITMTPLDTLRAPVVAGGTDIASWRCGSVADGTTLIAKYRPGSCQG